MVPDDYNKIQQEQLNQKLADDWPHTKIVIFEDESVYITDGKYVILSHTDPTPSDPHHYMDRAKWYSSSPT